MTAAKGKKCTQGQFTISIKSYKHNEEEDVEAGFSWKNFETYNLRYTDEFLGNV